MARVLLIQPPLSSAELFARGSRTSASILPPLGLAYLAAFLRSHGHECRILDGIAEPISLDAMAEASREYDVVGLTAVSTYAVRVIELIRKLKQSPACPPIVVGGPHVTALPDSLLRFGADYAVVGEGEITLLELVEHLAGNGRRARPDHVRGICFLDGTRTVSTGPRERIDPLDAIPLPARDLLPMRSYRSSVARGGGQPSHSMLTSRGCPGVCSFCSKRTFGTQVRYFGIERIVEEMFLLRDRHGARDVAIWDDNFFSDRKVVQAVCEELCRRDFGISWSAESRIDCADPETLRCIRKAGCGCIAYGIESGSQRVLDHINKRISKDEIRRAIAITKEAGIPIRGYFMIGLPGETAQDIEDTIRFAMELDLDLASFTLFVPLPGTLEYARACNSGTFDPEYYNKSVVPEFNFLDRPVYVPEGFTAESLLKLHRSAYNRYYLRPRTVWRRLASVRSLRDIAAAVRGGYTLAANMLKRM